ncbi:MAG: PIN/TRAM domain-containing protein [Armatimonadota bacterium]
MAIVRAVLLLVLSVVGAYLGYRVGIWYTSIPTIDAYIGDIPNLRNLSRIGFTVIGILAGIFAYSKVSYYITHLAENLREMPANDKIALCVGAVIGLLLTFLLVPLLNQITEPLLRITLGIGLLFTMVFLATQGAMSMRDELRKLLPPYGAVAEDRSALEQVKILDTNIIIDGRISEICRTGFIEGTLYVPGFVLDELQTIADSSDSLKRARGRRGLDILNDMQKEFSLIVRTYDHLVKGGEHEPVDSKLVRLAKEMNGSIVTNDFNLNKVAELQGVSVLNVNQLANSLKPVVLPGEELTVHVIKEGKEPGQGIAYLDDGTMVVVEHARSRVGETVVAVVTSVLQTVAGKMIFGNLKEVAEEEQELMDRNLRSYYRPERPRRGGRSH